MSDFRLIRFQLGYDLARITLARPPLNIMSIEMMEEINRALEAVAAHPTTKALALDAEGKAFSAGVDIEDHMGDRVKPMLDGFHGIFRRLRSLDCVTVAAVQGAALGGGAELATFCDLVLAADTATLGQPEIRAGVFPPVAALHYPVRIGVPRTLALLLSGEVIGAAEAARIGLVDRVVPAAGLGEALDLHLERFRAQSAVVLRLCKRAVRDSAGLPFETALAEIEDVYQYELMTTADASEGLRAFLEKRKPVWKDR